MSMNHSHEDGLLKDPSKERKIPRYTNEQKTFTKLNAKKKKQKSKNKNFYNYEMFMMFLHTFVCFFMIFFPSTK